MLFPNNRYNAQTAKTDTRQTAWQAYESSFRTSLLRAVRQGPNLACPPSAILLPPFLTLPCFYHLPRAVTVTVTLRSSAFFIWQKLAGASLLVFANKQDLEGALGATEIAEFLGLGSEQFENRHWSIVACSAVTGEGLVEGVDWTVGDIGARIFMMA